MSFINDLFEAHLFETTSNADISFKLWSLKNKRSGRFVHFCMGATLPYRQVGKRLRRSDVHVNL